MRAASWAVLASVTLLGVAASCASGSDAGEASNENVGSKGGGASGGAGGGTASGGAGQGGALPDAGAFPEGGTQGGNGGAAGAQTAGAAGTSAGAAGNPGAGAAGTSAGAAGTSAGMGGAGAAGTGGSQAGAAGAACVPQCAGKQCGSDGCTGQCGVCSPTQSCDAGVCKDSCLTSWKTPLTGITPSRAVVDAGLVYVAGKKGNQGYLGAFDACTGKETASQTTLVGASSSLISVQLSSTHVFAAGEGASVGLVVRAKRGSLALESSDPLVGSTDGDEVWDATPTPGGNLWMTGSAAVKTTPALWAIVGPIGQAACGFGPFAGSQGNGRAVVSGGGKVFVVGQRDQHGVVARYPDQNCAAQTPCTCPIEQSVSIMMGAALSDVRHAAYANGKLFIVGYGSDGTNSVSFLSRLDPSDLSIEATYTLDPTAIADAFLAVSVDAGMAYVGGMKGWQGDATFQSATAQVLAIPSAFGPGTQPLWIHEPAGGHVVWGVTAQGGSVYVSSSQADGQLMKCAAAGCN